MNQYVTHVKLPDEISAWMDVLIGQGSVEFVDAYSLRFHIDAEDWWEVSERLHDMRNELNTHFITPRIEKPVEL